MTSPADYDVRLVARAVRRYWWIVVAVPIVALALQSYRIRTAPFRAEFRAVVVLPGDTEDPGSSERPELMIMDDVPTLVGSQLFAERVAAQIAVDGARIDAQQVGNTLSASRYARTVTVVARDNTIDDATIIARAAQVVLPQAINDVLIVPGGDSASVSVIDPADGARRGEPTQWRVAGIVTTVMAFVGLLCALVVDGLRRGETA